MIASIRDVPGWLYVTYHHCLYQQELQPALSLYNCCAIYERPTFWSEPTHLTQTQGADMYCVDSRGNTWHMSCVGAREDTVDDCQHT